MPAPARPGEARFPKFVLVVLLSAVNGFATFLIWGLLNAILWQPYWRELRAAGFYTHDVGGALIVVVGPWIVGVLFLLAGITETVASAVTHSHSRARSFALIAIGPALVLLIWSLPGSLWHYPLSGTAVLVVGIGFWLTYDYVARRAEK